MASPFRTSGSFPASSKKLLNSLEAAEEQLAKAFRAVADAAAQADQYGAMRQRLNTLAYAVSALGTRVDAASRKVAETWIEKGIAL